MATVLGPFQSAETAQQALSPHLPAEFAFSHHPPIGEAPTRGTILLDSLHVALSSSCGTRVCPSCEASPWACRFGFPPFCRAPRRSRDALHSVQLCSSEGTRRPVVVQQVGLLSGFPALCGRVLRCKSVGGSLLSSVRKARLGGRGWRLA